MNVIIDEILNNNSNERDFGEAKKVGEMMKRRILPRIVHDLIDIEPTAAIVSQPLLIIDKIHAVIDSIGLNIIVRVDLHKPSLSLVQMESTYGKLRQVVEIFDAVRVFVVGDERITRQVEYEPVETHIVVR